MNAGLKFLDQMVREGRRAVTPAEYSERTGASSQAAWNALNRLAAQGILEKVARSKYAIRDFGQLGTSPAAEGLALAVASMFEGRPHRMGFRAALAHHGLLIHPWRIPQVATPLRPRARTLAGRSLQVVHESEETLHLGAASTREGAWVSNPERALVESAVRPRLGGGADVLAEALLAHSEFDVSALVSLASIRGFRTGLRRVGSVAEVVGRGRLADSIYELVGPIGGDIELEPGLPTFAGEGFRDKRWWVKWAVGPDELLSEVRQ